MIREGVTSHPLYWPPGWVRTQQRERSQFRPTSVHRETQNVLAELDRMGVGDWDVIVSTNLSLRRDGLPYSNQRVPADTGVAVWFTLNGEERVLACDRWDQVEHNLRAIAKHVEALRGQERWGVGSLEQAFRGFAALPETTSRSCWAVLELDQSSATKQSVRDAFVELALKRHPDQGGSPEAFIELNAARKEALSQLSEAAA